MLADTAAHEAAAVAGAVANERMHCIYRFAAFLQVCASCPPLRNHSQFCMALAMSLWAGLPPATL